MGTLTWRGDEVIADVQRAADDGLLTTAGLLQQAAQRINAERAYASGDMSRGWEPDGSVRVSGSVHSISVGNDVPYTIYVDKGTSRMAARNISASAMDEVAPQLPVQIASRLRLT